MPYDQEHGLRLGQILIRKGVLSESQLETALEEQEKTRELLGEVLIRLGFLTGPALFKVLAEQLGSDYVKLKDLDIVPSVISEVPVRLACHYHMVPIEIDGGTLTVASVRPLTIHHLDDLRLILKKEVKVVLAKEDEVADAIKKYYGVGAETIERLPTASAKLIHDTVSSAQDIGGQVNEDASIIKFVNQILLEAYRERATDIHIEPFEGNIQIRYRVDGILYDTKVPEGLKRFQHAVVSRIKIMANLDISEMRLPQDGRIKVKIDNQELDLRVSILPTPYGETVGIRLLSTSNLLIMENLGFSKKDREVLETLIQRPHGIIFVTGPTGSGKTTTLYAALSKINTKDRKIITIEDPIEYQLKGISQVQVHPKINLTFAQALRSMLRHDPDVMMVGEVRDSETADITIRAALTGHLVLSTIHTNNAAGGVTRLIDMGIEPFLLASAVECFIAQRLVRVICTHCKEEVTANSEVFKQFEMSNVDSSAVKFYEGKGCEACKNTGYRGRSAIYEILLMNTAIRTLVLERASSEQIRKKAMKMGMRTLRQDGWEKILSGVTTVAEVLRVTQNDESAE